MKLRVLTWNTWFEPVNYADRIREIMSISLSLSPDIICFQEVLPSFLEILSRNSALQDNYCCSDSNYQGDTLNDYGNITLCRKSIPHSFYFEDFESNMGRKLLICELSALPILIGNVHLESLANAPLRKSQLQVCSARLSNACSILCGDFNFCSEKNYDLSTTDIENSVLNECLPTFSDIWPALHPSLSGYTFDSNKNDMISRPERMRYDRILYHNLQSSSSPMLLPLSIQLVGDSPIEESSRTTSVTGSPSHCSYKRVLIGRRTVKLYPSDHFGLLCEFETAKPFM